jgi:hypothetical protein
MDRTVYVNTNLYTLLQLLRNAQHPALYSDIYTWTSILLTLLTKCISTVLPEKAV